MGKPTEELRRILDELGVKPTYTRTIVYKGYANPVHHYTRWKSSYGATCLYHENEEQGSEPLTSLKIEGHDITPEQAIAATVGNSTDLSKRLREVTGLHEFAELFGFSWADDSDWTWHDVACSMADEIDAATVGRSCASCPEMDNPDSYISHLHAALKWHDEHVPIPTNPINTCVVLQGEKPPEEVMFVAEGGGVTHYLPEATCKQEDWSTEGDHARVWLTCGHDCMVETVADLPKFCQECGARVVTG